MLYRYIQNRPEYYHLSEELAKYTCHILRRSYESLFQHLDNIVIAEGFSNSGACIGNGPFTSFAITRDFNCRPHRDEDDYDFGFIIWLREGNIIQLSFLLEFPVFVCKCNAMFFGFFLNKIIGVLMF